MRRGPGIFLLLVLLFGAAYGAWRAAQEGFDRLVHFTSPHFATERPTAGTTPLSGRLILVLVDGLRTEEAHLLPSLDWIRQQGASYRLTVPGPSYQPSTSATLLTGAPPSIHGVIRADSTRSLSADHLLQAALRSRTTAGGAGSPALGRLIAGTVETWHEGESLADLIGGVQALLRPEGPRLVIIQVEDLYRAMRQASTADTDDADYRDALAQLDAHLVKLFDQIDWKSTAVVVTGSTPLDQNGQRREGGTIPLLMAGSGVTPGARGSGSLLDVAPTVAALLGLPNPLEVQGRPLLEALQVDGRPADALMQNHLVARRNYTAAVLRALQADVTPADPPATVAEADGYLATLTQQVKEARFTRSREGIIDRLPYLGGGALLLLLYLVIVYRQPYGGPVLLGHLLYGVSFHALFFLLGGRYGPDLAGLDSPLGAIRLRFGLIAGAAMILATVTAGLLLSRKEFKRASYLTAAALHLALSLAAVLSLPTGIAVLLVGWQFPAELPATGLWIWFFLTALQVMVIGALSPLWAWTTVRAVRLGQRLWPQKEIGNPEINADKVVRLRAIRRSSKHTPRG